MASANLAMVFFTYFIVALLFGMFFLIMIIGGYFLWRFLRYKIRVEIYEKVGNRPTLSYDDFAREVIAKDEGGVQKTYLQLLKGYKGSKRVLLPKPIDYYLAGNRKKVNLICVGGKVIFSMPILSKDEFLQLQPESVTLDNGLRAFQNVAGVIDPDKVMDYIQAYENLNTINRELDRPKQSFIDKWGPSIVVFFPCLLFFILFLILIQKMSGPGGGGIPQIINLLGV